MYALLMAVNEIWKFKTKILSLRHEPKRITNMTYKNWRIDEDPNSAELEAFTDCLPSTGKGDDFGVIIAGGRDFNDYDLLEEKCKDVLRLYMAYRNVTIISGDATGADTLGERFAKEYRLKSLIFPAEWQKYGRAAGPIRNQEMANLADAVIAFWDGKSRGTKNMIDLAQAKGLSTHVVYI